MKDKNLFRLGHIRDCIEQVEYLANKLHCYDNFEKEWVEQYALLLNLEIIGEVAIHISDDLKAKYPDVAWREIRGMRNFIIQQYFAIPLSIIWDFVVNDIPILKKQIADIISDLGGD